MLITLASFTLMAIAVKELAGTISAPQIIFYRSLFSLLILLPIIFYSGVSQLRTNSSSKHFYRSLFHFAGQYGWIIGISFLPLAEVFALEFTVPIWMAIIATIFLRETATRIRILSIFIGALGVFIILQPSSEIFHPASFAVLASAMSYAIAHSLTKSLTSNHTAVTILFYMAVFQLPMGLVGSLNQWVIPEGMMWIWLLVISVTALSGHYSIAKAMALADAMVVMPMDFLRLPLIMIVGLILYNEVIEWQILLGSIVMLCGILLNLKYEVKAHKIIKQISPNGS